MQLETIDRLVGHLTSGAGHAVLTGATGSGLGHGIVECVRGLGEAGRRVARVDLSHPDPQGQPAQDLMPGDVVVLDARRSAAISTVERSLRAVVGAGADFLLVIPSLPDWDTALDAAREAGARTFVLRPWTEQQVRHALEERGAPTRDAAEVTRLSGGLPWLLRYLDADPASGSAPGPGGPAHLSDFVLDCLDSCPPEVADTVLALAVGYPVDGTLRLPAAPAGDDAQDRLLRSVGGAGLLGADGSLPPWVKDCVLRYSPRRRLQRLREQLVEDIVQAGGDLGLWAADLVEQGVTDARVLRALVDSATELARAAHPPSGSPGSAQVDSRLPRAGQMLRMAAEAGVRTPDLLVEQARVSLLTGDVAEVALAIDALLTMQPVTAPVPPDAVTVGLEVAWAQDLPHRADDILGWAAQNGLEVDRPVVAVDLLVAGDLTGGDRVLERAGRAADPADSATLLLARALRASLDGDGSAALPALMQAIEAADSTPTGPLAARSPAAVAALWGLHAGDLDLVDSVLGATLQDGPLGPLARTDLQLHVAWAAMVRGRLGEAEASLDLLGPLAPRHRLWVSALRVGLARRADDPVRLRAEWSGARETLLRHPVTLTHLLPLGELGLAAARVRDFDVVRQQWAQADALLADLGEPSLWSAPFHWYAVQVALQQDTPRELAPHAVALGRAAAHGGAAAVLSAAGRTWVRVRAGDVDPDAVEQAAGDLARAGWAWEAARLVAHGAAATTDRRQSARLLERARELFSRPAPASAGPPPDQDAPSCADNSEDHLRLSERERHVAQLVVAGRTYKEIGEVLYLSPKTIEHHVARIRRRSGVSSRSELLELLQSAVGRRPVLAHARPEVRTS